MVSDNGIWKDNAEVVWLFRSLRRRQDAVNHAEAELLWVRNPLPHETVDDALVARMENVVDRRLADLDSHLELMDKKGIESIPRMPAAWITRMAELRGEEVTQ